MSCTIVHADKKEASNLFVAVLTNKQMHDWPQRCAHYNDLSH